MTNLFAIDPKSMCGFTVAPWLIVIIANSISATPAEIELVSRHAIPLLDVPIVTVMDKKQLPPSGDRHDYYALAPYHWPNPNTPDGRPAIFRDGRVNPIANSSDYDRTSYFAMGNAITSLAVAYQLTDEERFAQRAAQWIRAWFVTNDTRMNPNLSFAQCLPGETQGLPIGLIRGNTIIEVVQAERIISRSGHWSDADHQSFVTWIDHLLEWLTTSELGIAESKAANNHGTWYAAQVAVFALVVGKESLAREQVEKVRDSRIKRQITPDGRQPLEMLRTKSWDYSVMNLEGLIVIADVGITLDINLWDHETADHRSIRAAMNYLLPFATGAKAWRGEQIQAFRADRLLPALDRAIIAWPESNEKLVATSSKIRPNDASVVIRRQLFNVPWQKHMPLKAP